MNLDPVRAIADAVLYEGYLLWPYRRSALKNTRRWTFGGVYPRGHHERHPDDRWQMRTECLVQGGADATVDVRVRFLHIDRRQVHRRVGDVLEPVEQLTVAGERHLSWEEATERELAAGPYSLGQLVPSRRIPLALPATDEQEDLLEGDLAAGAIVRSWKALEGAVELSARELEPGLFMLTVEVSNTTPFGEGTREQALERTLCSTHTVIRADRAELVSLTDPPGDLRAHAEACRNDGTWPVLVGEPGERHTLLSSPIILEDYPRIAPESPGDLFDGGEIDQLLTLNILSLTDEEKAEMRESDPRAREILERTESLSEEELMSLHGAIRDLRHVH